MKTNVQEHFQFRKSRNSRSMAQPVNYALVVLQSNRRTGERSPNVSRMTSERRRVLIFRAHGIVARQKTKKIGF